MVSKLGKQKKKILIIALVNEFDVILYTGIYKILRNFADASVTLLTRNTSRDLIPFIDNVDHVLFFDEVKLKDRLNDPSYSIIEKHLYLRDYLNELSMAKYDSVINLSHCPTSANIVNILEPREATGIYYDDFNNRYVSGEWMKVFFASVNADKYNPLLYFDMFAMEFAQEGSLPRPYMKEDTSLDPMYAKVRERFNVKGRELVLISCASKLDEGSRWNLDEVIKLANKLAKRGEKVLVFSGPEGSTTLRNVESYVDKSVTCEVMLALDMTIFMKYTKVVIAQNMPALAIPAIIGVPMIYLSINELNFKEACPPAEGAFVLVSDKTEVSHVLVDELVGFINSGLVEKVLSNRENVQDIPLEVPEYVKCFFTRYDNDGFLSFDALEKLPISKDELYSELFREMWKVLLRDKLTNEAFNDYVNILKNSYRRNEVLASISFAKYDIGTLELFQQHNKECLEILGAIVHKNASKGLGIKAQMLEVDRLNRKMLILFNRNPFLTLIKFYFLILYENTDKIVDLEQRVASAFDFSKKMEVIFSFIIFCLTRSSEVIFEDFNMLDEVIGGDDSVIYH